jgi:predicted GIY-YIG superfamily endonuclease
LKWRNKKLQIDPNIFLVKELENELVISHKIIAQQTENKEKSVLDLITRNLKELEEFGNVKFRVASNEAKNFNPKPEKIYYLNKKQTIFLLLIMKIPTKLSVLFAKYGEPFQALEEYSKFQKELIKTFVYIIQFDNGNLKIGFSSNPTKRLRSLETQSGNLIVKRFLLKFDSKKEALAQEKNLHKQFAEFRTQGEYFNIDFEEVVKRI